MEKIGLFWGSNTGNQEEATNFLTDYMKSEGYEIELYNIAETPPAKMLEYKKLIIGCPTWHIGELQDDWDTIYEEYKKLDFSNITAAFFGCGDQVGYSDNFLDARRAARRPPCARDRRRPSSPPLMLAQELAGASHVRLGGAAAERCRGRARASIAQRRGEEGGELRVEFHGGCTRWEEEG